MTEYEKALIDYGEKRALWKWEKEKWGWSSVRILQLSEEPFNTEEYLTFYRRMRNEKTFYGKDSLLKERILSAWNARCKVMKLRKERNND